LLNQITTAITDKRGWDLLLFAGHSNETRITGGELAIAPNVSITLSELAPYLKIAKQRGLQFALFNSCSGLDIAKFLVDLGFNQVAVMREPIHNKVAQEFLVQFLRSMAQYRDAHDALLIASQFLKLEKNLTYPSSALIPSLFCRPGQEVFRSKNSGVNGDRATEADVTQRIQTVQLTHLVAHGLADETDGYLLKRR